MTVTRLWLRTRCNTGPLGRAVSDADYDVLLTGDTDIYKPDGDILLSYRRGALSEPAMAQAWPILYRAKTSKTNNRGIAAGGERTARLRKDGTLSKTSVSVEVSSMILGYYDRYPRIPYCRQTATMAANLDEWEAAQPLLQEIAAVYAAAVPDRYKAQMRKAAATSEDFVIRGTPWTTVTVNHNWQTMLHTDKGDWIGPGKGFGVITALTRGEYAGGVLVYPRYRVGVDLRGGDVLMMDSHEAHANTPIDGPTDELGEALYDRISLVLYYRSRMSECGSAIEELERAKRVRGAL